MPVDEPSQRQARTFPVQTDATPPSPTTERGHTPADIWIIRRELRARPPTTTWLSIGERCRATGSSRRRLRSRHRSHYAPTDRQRSRRPCDRRAAPSSLADSNMSTGPARSSNPQVVEHDDDGGPHGLIVRPRQWPQWQESDNSCQLLGGGKGSSLHATTHHARSVRGLRSRSVAGPPAELPPRHPPTHGSGA